jgi:23S rRNA pseudouridine2605 synthase
VKERIQKLLANAGVASRRNVEEMVRQGRITVNGQVVTELPILVDPSEDKITADGESIKLAGRRSQRRLYILLNKPKNVYSTNVAQGEQVRAIDLLPPNLPQRVYPVGRLDAGASGLLLLTNDGDLTNQLTHPRYGVAKTYRATVAGFVEDETLAALKRSGSENLRVSHRSDASTVLEITIRESRDKQIRQMLADAGHKVRDLMRTRLGPLTLHGLAVGQSRPLTSREVSQLHRLGKPASSPHKKNHSKKMAGKA